MITDPILNKLEIVLFFKSVHSDGVNTTLTPMCCFWYYNTYKVSKVGDCSRGQPEGSLFNSYYT